MELSRFELAAIKRTAQNVRMLRNKLAKVTEKWQKIDDERKALESEINDWETPILKKYGFTSEEILSGEADRKMNDALSPDTSNEAVTDMPVFSTSAFPATDMGIE